MSAGSQPCVHTENGTCWLRRCWLHGCKKAKALGLTDGTGKLPEPEYKHPAGEPFFLIKGVN